MPRQQEVQVSTVSRAMLPPANPTPPKKILLGLAPPPPPDTAPLCSVCSTLDLRTIFRDGLPDTPETKKSLGPLTRILASAPSCGLCSLITTLFNRSWLLDSECKDIDLSRVTDVFLTCQSAGIFDRNSTTPETKIAYRLFVSTNDKPIEIYNAQLENSAPLLMQLQLMEGDAARVGRARELHGRRVGETVDRGLIKQWMSLCHKYHGKKCEDAWWRWSESPGKRKLPPSVRMLDVVDMCLVPASDDCRFVALSYLWGADLDFSYSTKKATYEERCKKGGMEKVNLPPTILDTIGLVKEIGERYLWVDALCIIQDSPEDKMEQIGEMHNIYGWSMLTICTAAGTSASAPVPGVRTGVRKELQKIEVLQGLHIAVPMGSLLHNVVHSRWETRGWTYQERVLSRRRLFMTPEQVYFECNEAIWYEDCITEPSPSAVPIAYPNQRSTLQGRPQFPPNYVPGKDDDYVDRFITSVESYTKRVLSYESDIVNAFSAVFSMLTEGFHGVHPETPPFQCSLPTAEIEHAMLWHPLGSTLLTRRTGVNGVVTPSWSWVGWRGPVKYGDIEGYITGNPKCQQWLVDEWVLVDETNNTRKLKMRHNYFWTTLLPPAEEKKLVRYMGLPEKSEPSSLVDELSASKSADPDAAEKVFVPGTLVFRTSALRFKVRRVPKGAQKWEYVSPHYALYNIISSKENGAVVAGKMILPSTTMDGEEFEFVVLSRAGAEYGDAVLNDEKPDGRRYPGDMLNVMAVQEVQVGASIEIGGVKCTLVERVSVGVVFEKRWVEAAGGPEGIERTARVVVLQ
ncbi:heterokaryon incompatibility protein-domain-containing protein [Kalaharituber pfeilii]|nr:heterokaryon incompatibility protein-domain-containing protein [Kalaharituber pfeilii]